MPRAARFRVIVPMQRPMMTTYHRQMPDPIRDAYRDWRDAAAARSARGELRASRDERELLERFVTLLDASSPESRQAWESERASLDADETRCDCGHPPTHHDADGSCFHVVGCATGCACRSSATSP